jgi:uncharacterized membrane protein
MINLLVTLLIAIVILSLVFYIIQTFLPIDPKLKQLILLVVGVIFVIWLLLAVFGGGGVGVVRLPLR